MSSVTLAVTGNNHADILIVSLVMNDKEKARLSAVYALNLLDTAPEERFDRITRLCKSYFGMPIAIVLT